MGTIARLSVCSTQLTENWIYILRITKAKYFQFRAFVNQNVALSYTQYLKFGNLKNKKKTLTRNNEGTFGCNTESGQSNNAVNTGVGMAAILLSTLDTRHVVATSDSRKFAVFLSRLRRSGPEINNFIIFVSMCY